MDQNNEDEVITEGEAVEETAPEAPEADGEAAPATETGEEMPA